MGRLRIKPKDKLFKQTCELRNHCKQINSPQQLAVILYQIGNPTVRQAVLDRMRPYLKFKLDSNFKVSGLIDAQVVAKT